MSTEDELEHEKITGFKTPAEWHAYQLGRDHEEKVIVQFIDRWDGSTRSILGGILLKKFEEWSKKERRDDNNSSIIGLDEEQ